MDELEKLTRELAPMTISELKAVATRGGVPWQSVYRIAAGRTTNPTFRTVEGIRRGLQGAPCPTE